MRTTLVSLALLIAACGQRSEPPPSPITVFAAASLARPLKVLSDSVKSRARITVLSELGGSLEQSRKITDLGRIPDALMLVDDDVIAALLPTHLEWYVRFATNRLVVTHTPRSRFADSINTENWWRMLSRSGVRVGRADPQVAPVGRHALDMLGRTDAYYGRRGLSDSLRARASLKYVRPNATELAALLETGEVDYIIDYESVARQYGFQFVPLPDDLAPSVLYGISVPRQAPHAREGIQFVTFVLSPAGQQILRDAQIHVLSVPVAIGSNVPREITELVRTSASITPGH